MHSHAFARHFAGMKAFRVHNDDDMRAALSRTVAFGIEMIVTEIIPGDDDQFFSYYSYIDEEGEPLLHATKRKLRQYPIWFGSGCFHATDRNPEVAELGLRFFEGVGLRGLGNVEFKRDARDGRLKLIECNHRFTAATGLMRAAGLDLPLFVYNKLTDRPLPPVDEYRPGMTMWYPMRDLRAFAAYRREGEISLLPWLRSIMRRHHYPVASLSDPRPVLANNLRVFGRIRRVLSRQQGAAGADRSRSSRLGDEQSLCQEQVAGAVVDADRAQLPDRAPLLHHRAGQQRLDGGVELAGGADGRVGGPRARDRKRVGEGLHGGGTRPARVGRVVLVGDLDREAGLEVAGVVGEVRAHPHVGDVGQHPYVGLVGGRGGIARSG